MIWTTYQINKLVSISCFVSSFEKHLEYDYIFNGEMHDFWEMLYVVRGNVCVSADERVYNLKENNIIFHKPMELHKFHANSESDIFVMSFKLNGKIANTLCDRTQALNDTQKNNLENIIQLFRKNRVETEDKYYEFIGAFDVNPLLSNQVACATELFLLSICEDKTSMITAIESTEAEIFKKCVIQMEERITEAISVEDFASKQNISVSYLKKVFAKFAGVGVHKYFIRTKITYACKLLREGKSVYEVSDMLSFSSPNYFCLAFKRETGKTPSQFKTEKII